LIYAETRGEYLRVTIIAQGGVVIGEDRLTQGKTTEDSRVRKYAEKTLNFDSKKERRTFEDARKEFRRDQGSSSRTWLELCRTSSASLCGLHLFESRPEISYLTLHFWITCWPTSSSGIPVLTIRRFPFSSRWHGVILSFSLLPEQRELFSPQL
jgi:hypothetical protein